MKYAQFVIGPAGSGKSTYTAAIQQHCKDSKRIVHCVNLDPAAETFHYEVSIDIRNLISLDDVSEELEYGPNGGLVFCMEYLLNNISWLIEEIGEYEDDYLIVDCPGQIELYSHFSIMKDIVTQFENNNYRVCAVYIMDSQFIQDPFKFFSGALSAMSAMIRLEIPHVNVLTKMDLVDKKEIKKKLKEYLCPDINLWASSRYFTSERYQRLGTSIAELVTDYGMVSFLPLNRENPNSIMNILHTIDNAIQYGEDLEPKEPLVVLHYQK